MKYLLLSVLLFSSSCGASESPSEQSAQRPMQTTKAETIKTESGLSYAVTRETGFGTTDLPQNSDLKMADGDLAKYAIEGCTLYTKAEYAPSRCDVYVQADKSGTLIGYLFMMQNKEGVSFQTATTLNEQKEPGGRCGISGNIYQSGSGYEQRVKDGEADFDGQMMFATTVNGAGATLVSQVEGDNDPDGPHGVWYVKKSGNKVRINQERWNYCYKNPDVVVDDVFFRAVTLTRI